MSLNNINYLEINKNKEEEKQMGEQNKNDLWEESQRNVIIEALRNGQELSEIMKKISNLDKAFSRPLDTLVCSDERVPAGDGIKMGIAGQLILASEEESNNFVASYKGKIKTVTSHDGCGAAAVKFQDLKNKGDNVPDGVNNADELGIMHSRHLAEMLGAEYRHIPAAEMTGKVHNARAICVDGTGKFNPAVLKDMPAHFVCSGAGLGLSKEYNQAEIKILAGIATGSHGFGEKFNNENPLYIFISAKDQDQKSGLESMAKNALADFGDKIQIKSFIHTS
jgi:hypothetical protein